MLLCLSSALSLLQEAGASLSADDWCRSDGAPLLRGDCQRFPYAVVEIKLQGVGQPAWIRRLVASGVYCQ
jgi:SPX domain protein involved in polyphosphate accumulation